MIDTIVVGAGNMGAKWLRTVRDHPGTRPVALVDLDEDRAREVAADAGLADLRVGADLERVITDAASATALVDATVPAAHRDVTARAMRADLSVLGEKPAAATLAETVALAALREAIGGRFVVSQSRRFNPQLAAVRAWLDHAAEEGAVVGGASVRFSRGPRFGGFRDGMPSPLLVDMAIHLFDMARWLAGDAPSAVYARETNPPWSWYRGDASAAAVIEFARGAVVSFDGTWAGLGADTSWNGDWRIATDLGVVVWDGDRPAHVHEGGATRELAPLEEAGSSLAGSLSAFVRRVVSDDIAADGIAAAPADNDIDDNVLSMVIVEAALASAASGARVRVPDLLADAAATARAHGEEWGMPEIADVIDGWPDPAARFGAR